MASRATTGSLRSIDLDDITELADAGPVIRLRHRPDTDTPLKNGRSGERPVNLSRETFDAVQTYTDNYRIDTTDDHGRPPFGLRYDDAGRCWVPDHESGEFATAYEIVRLREHGLSWRISRTRPV